MRQTGNAPTEQYQANKQSIDTGLIPYTIWDGGLIAVNEIRGTTIISVRTAETVVVGGDGQVTLGDSILKGNARKVRRLYKDKVLVGFAGATADAFTLFERFEAKLDMYQGRLDKAAVELAKDWRTDRVLRRLEAMMAVADSKLSLLITGTGDVIEPEGNGGLIAIGSGGQYARAAAQALLDATELTAQEIATRSLTIAASICVYTNEQIHLETLPIKP